LEQNIITSQVYNSKGGVKTGNFIEEQDKYAEPYQNTGLINRRTGECFFLSSILSKEADISMTTK